MVNSFTFTCRILFFIIVIASMLSVKTMYAIDKPLKLTGNVIHKGKPLKGVKVDLIWTGDGKSVLLKGPKYTDESGLFGYIYPEHDGEYRLEFSHKDMFSVYYEISTITPSDVAKAELLFDMGDIEMVESVAGVKKNIFIQPVGKILYYADRRAFDFEKKYHAQKMVEIDDLKDEIEAIKNNANNPEIGAKNTNANNNVNNNVNDIAANNNNGNNNNNNLNSNNNNSQNLADNKLPTDGGNTDEINLVDQADEVKADDKSIGQYLNELKAVEKQGNNKDIADLLHKIGKKYHDRDDLPKSIEHLNRALDLMKKVGDIPGEAAVISDLAWVDFDGGNYEDAIDKMEVAAGLLEGHGEKQAAIKAFNDLAMVSAEVYRFDKAIKNLDKALAIAKELNDKPVITTILNDIGSIYFEQGDFDNALDYFKQSLIIDEELDDQSEVAASLQYIGVTLHKDGELDEALAAYEKSLKISEDIGDRKGVSTSLNNIGNINYDWQKFNEALEYYNKSLKIKEELQYKKGIALSFHNIGNVHVALKDYPEALDYYEKSNVLAKELSMKELLKKNFEAISSVYYSMKRCDDAYTFYKLFNEASMDAPGKSEPGQIAELSERKNGGRTIGNTMIAELRDEIEKQKVLSMFKSQSKQLEIELKNKQIEDQENEASIQSKIIYGLIGGAIFFLFLAIMLLKENKQKKKANALLEEQKGAIQSQAEQLIVVNKELDKLSIVARETDNSVVIAKPDGEISWVNEGFTRLLGYSLSEFKEKFGSNLADGSSNPNIREVIGKCINEKTTVEYISVTKTKDGREVWLQTTVTPAFDKAGNISELVAIDSDVTGLKKVEQEVKEQQKELVKAFKQSSRQQIALHKAMIQIEDQKNEITDSIQYASRIQTAIFPPTTYFDEILTEYFIFNKPRDIVSGDFYWCSRLGDKAIVAASDCTGHGVPGAFMSLLGVTFMNEIINNYELQNIVDVSASQILNDLRDHIIRSLRQTGEIGGSRDGMDIALCVIDNKKEKLQYAGANNPMYLVRKTDDPENPFEMQVYKADKMPIGIHAVASHSFYNNEIDIVKGDTLYLFSDGYIDQFGGPKGKKLKSHNFRELLLGLQEDTMAKQKQIIAQELADWMGDNDQIDDVLVIGVRI